MTGPAQPTGFRRRQRAAALSLWELGDLLGIHPHQLPDGVVNPNLATLPINVVIDLASRLDMHPADLVPALDSVLDTQRLDAAPGAAEPGADDDALAVLTALATATGPLLVDELAAALRWTLDRAQAALGHAEARPGLAGPLALRRTAPHTYTVGPRLDVLTNDQRTAVLNAAQHSQPLTIEQANVLLAAIALRGGQRADGDRYEYDEPPTAYPDWREAHLDTERELRARGLLHADHRPDRIQANPAVLYSLRYRDTPEGY